LTKSQNDKDLTWIVNLLNKSESKSGSKSVPGLEILPISFLLFSIMDFGDDIPENDGLGIARTAIINVASKRNITNKTLVGEIKKLTNDYLNLPINRFVISTTISITKPNIFKRLYFGNSQIILESNHPPKFEKEQKALEGNTTKALIVNPPENYLPVRVHVSARSIDHAFNKGIDTLDYFRGIWNLHINRGNTFRFSFSGKTKPVNKIVLGPIHFIHHPNGELVNKELFYYDPNYKGAINPIEMNQYQNIIKFTNGVLNKIKKVNYKAELINSIVRYTNALDDSNLQNSYLKLWGLLEKLTDTIYGSNEETAKRAAYLYPNNQVVLKILHQLRNYRNKSVHAGEETSAVELYVYELKTIVEKLLFFSIDNPFKFTTFKEIGDFLKQPHEIEHLKYRADLARNALQYLYKK